MNNLNPLFETLNITYKGKKGQISQKNARKLLHRFSKDGDAIAGCVARKIQNKGEDAAFGIARAKKNGKEIPKYTKAKIETGKKMNLKIIIIKQVNGITN